MKSNDFKESMDVLFEVSGEIGFTQVVYARQAAKCQIDKEEWLPLRLNVRNFPSGWEAIWREFESHDPYYHACFDGTMPFDWASVQSNQRLNEKERAAWKYLADFGLIRGITIPIHQPNGKFAVVSMIQDKANLDWRSVYESNYESAFCMAHIFHEVITELGFVEQAVVARPDILSPRERECLSWAALGKTSPEIAMIIDRSSDTVRLHIKNAMLKLGASTRTHAVAKAVQLDLLDNEKFVPRPYTVYV